MEELLKRIILENQELIAGKNPVPRNYHIHDTGNITVLTGIRRCGKTHLLYQIAKTYDAERVLLIDFEDERLIGLNAIPDYDIIIDSYRTLFPDLEPVLFFDEIQNLQNWHFYLKRLHVKGYKIYVTGSNAHLLSREIATFLKGHSLETTIYPYRNSFVQRESKRKTYLADNSFIFLNRVSPDKSRLFENLAFNFLQKKYPDIYYYKAGKNKEVDFFINEPDSKILIQACYDIRNEDTRVREVKSLLKAMEELNLSLGTIYSYNHSEEIKIKYKIIKIVPFRKVAIEAG